MIQALVGILVTVPDLEGQGSPILAFSLNQAGTERSQPGWLTRSEQVMLALQLRTMNALAV